jgi:hypothetical protein
MRTYTITTSNASYAQGLIQLLEFWERRPDFDDDVDNYPFTADGLRDVVGMTLLRLSQQITQDAETAVPEDATLFLVIDEGNRDQWELIVKMMRELATLIESRMQVDA